MKKLIYACCSLFGVLLVSCNMDIEQHDAAEDLCTCLEPIATTVEEVASLKQQEDKDFLDWLGVIGSGLSNGSDGIKCFKEASDKYNPDERDSIWMDDVKQLSQRKCPRTWKILDKNLHFEKD